jgi:hypothetical protein
MQKGQFIGIFWIIFNLGGVVGSAVAFGTNYHSKANAVSTPTYIGFLVLAGIGIMLPLFMADPKKMVRTDGTRVVTIMHPSWKSEILGLWIALRTDPYIILLFPMFLASNWFYTWRQCCSSCRQPRVILTFDVAVLEFNDYNGALFNIRTRAFNSMLYWMSQMFGSVAIGLLLDSQRFTRRTRAFAGWIVLLAMVMIVHGWGYHYQTSVSPS